MTQSLGQSDYEQGRIIALENAWNQALQQKDASALKMLLAPDLIYVEHDGVLMNKSQYLASVQLPEVHPARIVSEGMHLHPYGAAVVVTGVYRENGIRDGKPYALRERFIDTWIRQGTAGFVSQARRL